jgi:hypothetical protein
MLTETVVAVAVVGIEEGVGGSVDVEGLPTGGETFDGGFDDDKIIGTGGCFCCTTTC